MALASTASDVLTGVCMTLVVSMGALLVYRGSRKRPEDRDEDEA